MRYPLSFIFLLVSFFSEAQDDILYQKVLAITEKVESERKFPGEPGIDSVMSLPFGIKKSIGGKSFFIAIDSAFFTPSAAYCDIYMAVELPGATKKIAFAAKEIPFNPKGFKPSTNGKMKLLSEISIPIGPNINLLFKNDGTNFVEWDCEGFKGISLSGTIQFSNSILIPVSTQNNQQFVSASFSVYTQNPNDIIISATISPFKIKGIEDFTFTIDQAIFDLSTYRNYLGQTGSQSINSNYQNPCWTGLYLKQFKLTLPSGIRSSSNQSATLSLKNLYIDDSGVNGRAELEVGSSLEHGTISGWKFSVGKIIVEFVSNRLSFGEMSGTIFLPIDESSALNYSANLSQNNLNNQIDFLFIIKPQNIISCAAFSAKMELFPNSIIKIERQNGNFVPTALLNGKIKFQAEDFNSPFLGFQNLTIKSTPPFVSGGIFSLAGVNTNSLAQTNSIAGFQACINEITLNTNLTNPFFYVNAGITFTSMTDMAFGATIGIKIKGKIISPENESQVSPINSLSGNKLVFDGLKFEDVNLSVHTTSLKLEGKIQFKNNDPLYGKGFSGSIEAVIPPLSAPISSTIFLGKKSSYSYFYIDAAIPSTLIIFPPTTGIGLASYRLLGGLSYKMKPFSTNLNSSLYSNNYNTSRTYIPDSSKACSFVIGSTLGTYPLSNIANGDVTLETVFNQNGGIDLIQSSGRWCFGIGINERVGKAISSLPLSANLNFQYDFISKVLDANLGIQLNTPSANGNGQGNLHISQNNWNLFFGKPSNRATINLTGLGNFQMYLMTGNFIEPIPDPPQQVQAICQTSNYNSRNNSQLSAGQSFVFGASYQSGFSNTYGFSFFQVYSNINYGAGFDLMTQKISSTTKCLGTNYKPGWNSLRVEGNVFAYLQGCAGIRGHLKWPIGCESACVINEDFDLNIIDFSFACILQGKFPNPNYAQGSVAVQYNIFGKINGILDLKFESGTNCELTQ